MIGIGMEIETLIGYHDAELVSIQMDAPGGVSLGFRLYDGTPRKLILADCEIFRIVDATLQNVVSRVMMFHGEKIESDYINEKLDWASSLMDASSFLNAEKKESIVQQIRLSTKMLIVVEPSCGAEIVATCSGYVEQ